MAFPLGDMLFPGHNALKGAIVYDKVLELCQEDDPDSTELDWMPVWVFVPFSWCVINLVARPSATLYIVSTIPFRWRADRQQDVLDGLNHRHPIIEALLFVPLTLLILALEFKDAVLRRWWRE